ncbi:MAG: acyltransferase family protein [Acidobacteria bacterium]|nr:acyltransferase family protein [Acidobacteriota bacterium]
MSEVSKIVKMKQRERKVGTKARNHRAGVSPVQPLPSLEARIDAKIEERFAEFERHLERSFSSIEAKLEQALAASGRQEPGVPRSPWTSALSALERLSPVAELKPLVGETGAFVIEQLEKLGFIQVLGQTFTNVINHISMDVDEFGYDQEFEDKMRPLVEFLFYNWWRVEMNGVEHIPKTGRALLVSNHSGTLPFDGAMIKFGVRELHPKHRIARVLMHDMFNSLPILGPIMSKVGAVRACQENGERLLRAGHVTMVFPEGAKGTGKYFKNRYKLERFGRGGFVQLAARTSSPVIPIAVVGAEEIYPLLENSTVIARLLNVPYFPLTPTFPWLGLLGFIPLPSKWYIDIGEPITFDHLSAKDLEDDFLMDNLGNEVRQQIQNTINDRLKRRRSVWFG